ncbi:NADH-quinone oxidoreductase subunit C [Coprothermobacter platensis]|uniref:NADH-quinone oxidoreductase subunit C n=1 Tax=Coprothermobacter platensis TaxID=108819 RepID=UPI0003737A19|nr:NADH-quinone oxidoreductase subunit C [Coprothermobacter platensis]
MLPGISQTKLEHYGIKGEGEREIVDIDIPSLMQFVLDFRDDMRFITITAYPQDENLYMQYHFTLGDWVVSLRLKVPEDKTVPSITPLLPAADWAEREIMDLFDITFSNHPRPKRLIIPDDAKRGIYLET